MKDVSSGVDSQYMTVNFASRYDDGGMIKIGRLVFCVNSECLFVVHPEV